MQPSKTDEYALLGVQFLYTSDSKYARDGLIAFEKAKEVMLSKEELKKEAFEFKTFKEIWIQKIGPNKNKYKMHLEFASDKTKQAKLLEIIVSQRPALPEETLQDTFQLESFKSI